MRLGVGGIYRLPTFAALGVLLCENARTHSSNGRVQDDSTTRGLNECQRDIAAGGIRRSRLRRVRGRGIFH